jgi:hypothetical protein
MIGGVFGNVNGVAPGLEFTATYKKLQLYSANEDVFDTDTKAGKVCVWIRHATHASLPDAARYPARSIGAVHA